MDQQRSVPQSRTMTVLLWVALLAGLTGFGLALAALHVPSVVGSLIIASIAALVLLRLREERHPERFATSGADLTVYAEDRERYVPDLDLISGGAPSDDAVTTEIPVIERPAELRRAG